MPSRLVPQLDPQLRLMTKVALMYHERGIRQAQIAESLGLSQAKVSRLLKRAEQVGIVRTTVTVAPGLNTALEEQLEKAFGLAEAVITEADDDADDAEIITTIGSAAAAYLEGAFAGGERIGISSWSQALLATADRMRPTATPAADEVVQLLGGMGVAEVQTKANRLVDAFARMLGASPYYVQAPGVVSDRATRDGLMRDPSLAEVTGRWASLTSAVVGIGRIEPSDLLEVSGNAFSPAERRTLLDEGAVGDICHRVFRADGSAIVGDIDERTISIPTADFLAIPRRIGVAGGRDKVEPIRGALAGGWVTALITDTTTARALLAG